MIRFEPGGRIAFIPEKSESKREVVMYYSSYKAAMAEQFPSEDQPKRDIADDDWNVLNGLIDNVIQRQDRTDAKVKRLQDADNLKRAERDTASGKLRSAEPSLAQRKYNPNLKSSQW